MSILTVLNLGFDALSKAVEESLSLHHAVKRLS